MLVRFGLFSRRERDAIRAEPAIREFRFAAKAVVGRRVIARSGVGHDHETEQTIAAVLNAMRDGRIVVARRARRANRGPGRAPATRERSAASGGGGGRHAFSTPAPPIFAEHLR